MTRTLLSSVKNCDTNLAKSILKKGQYENINARDSCEGGTALFWACSNGLIEIAHILIALNADIEAATAWKATPLHASADNNHLSVARMLLKHKANVNSTTIYGDTPCHLAAYRGHRDMVKLLIDCEADLSATNCKNRTSLDESICSSHDDISKYIHKTMVRKNYNPKRLSEYHMTEIPLDLADSSNVNSFEHNDRFQYSSDENEEEENRFMSKDNCEEASTHYAVPVTRETQIVNRLSSDVINIHPSDRPIDNTNIYPYPNIYPYRIPNNSYSVHQRPLLQTHLLYRENIGNNESISDSDNSTSMNNLSLINTPSNHSQLSYLNIYSRLISDNI